MKIVYNAPMRYVLRLETLTGDGFYCSGLAQEICLDLEDVSLAYDLDGRHPGPTNDSKLWKGISLLSSYSYPWHFRLFGFESYAQFRAWFFSDKFLEKAGEHDALLCLYSVEEKSTYSLIEGNTQCVFDKRDATAIATFNPLATEQEIQKAIDAHKNGV